MSGNRPADISTVTNAIKLLLKIEGIDPKEVLHPEALVIGEDLHTASFSPSRSQ
jgi:hypothetical protein